VTELFVKSNITEAPSHTKVGSAVTIRGFAFSGAPDVAKVELTDDDGATWREADLDREHDPFGVAPLVFPVDAESARQREAPRPRHG